ncbi:DUF4240 domain-containing protein [bacterium]|nr:MAG: DUF4240 domain-containing protein [bacterium]
MASEVTSPSAFWDVIAKARTSNDPTAPSASPEALGAVLCQLPSGDVLFFAQEYRRKLVELNRWPLWGAGYVIAGGMSDDGFHYFRSWILGKGPEVFGISLTDPDALGPYVDDPEVENETLEYVATKELEKRDVALPELDSASPDDEPQGEPFDEDSVYEDFPRLAAQFSE